MVSEDFKKLMELIYQKKFKVESYQVTIISNKSIKTKISLKKDSNVETIESHELDLGLYVMHLKKTANSNGHLQFTHIKNAGTYYGDIEFLVDENRSKKRAAMESVRSGKYQPDFDFDKEFQKLLSGKYSKYDKQIAKLKTYYYEILASTIIISTSFVKLRKKVEKEDNLYAEHASSLDDLLNKAFNKGKNAVERLKFFKEMIKIDIEGLASITLVEEKFFENQFEMLEQKGTTRGDVGIKYVLDWYRRWCELSSDFINATRIAYDLIKGNSKPNEYLPYVQNVEILKQSPYSKIVEYIDPYIRHAESHITTKIEYEQGRAGNVVLLDTRRGKTKEIKRYSFEQIVCETALKLLVLCSPEYKFMLLKIGR